MMKSDALTNVTNTEKTFKYPRAS